jgi:hypothetical protein
MTISTPNDQRADKINMSLQITSSSSSSINSETTNNNQDKTQETTITTKNQDKQYHEEIMTPKQRETKKLQAINSSNANDNNDDSPGSKINNIGYTIIPSRATNNTTRKNHKNTSSLIPELKHHQEQTKPIQESTPNTSKRAKNIEEWKAIFSKARETRPKTQEQPKTTQRYRGIQPTIMPIEGNEAFGNPMEPIDQEKTFRIYFQNVNGLEIGKGTRKWEDIIQEMTTRQVSVCGIAETNTEWHAEKTKSTNQSKLRNITGQATMTTSTTNLKFKTIYKPGGTATIAIRKWSGRVLKEVTDPSGQG